MNYNMDIEEFNVNSEKVAMEVFRRFRWDKDIYCPYCESKNHNKNGKDGETQNYICMNEKCNKSFSDCTKTFFAYHKIPMKDIFSIFYICYHSPDKTIKEIAKELETSPRHISPKVKFFKEVFLKERSIIKYDETEKIIKSIVPGVLYDDFSSRLEKEKNYSLDDFKK